MQSLKCLLTATRFSESLLLTYSLSPPQGMAADTTDKARARNYMTSDRRKVSDEEHFLKIRIEETPESLDLGRVRLESG